jgi:UDP-N-acetylmuramoyl-tripeptide--D-alanyl-D-alanine ligase
MDLLSLAQLADVIHGQLTDANPELTASEISTDSRSVQPGDLFWCLSGDRFDGHDFAAAALSRGAVAAVVAKPQASRIPGPRIIVRDPLAALGTLARWHRRRQDAMVIGVTGSVGKTSTKELIYAALSKQFQGMRSPGNFNNQVGLPKSLLSIGPHDEFAVLELGASREGEISRLAALAEPEVGVITAIGKAHLESFGSVAGIIRGKGELLEALPESGFAVLPGDDPITVAMASRARCRAVFVGEHPDNDVRASDVQSTPEGLRFWVDQTQYDVPIMGRHQLTNALLAIAIGKELGIPAELIAAGLRTYAPVGGRARVLRSGPWTVIDDTYNASPTAMEAACHVLADWPCRPGQHRFFVAGDMKELGSTAEAEHRQIGSLAARLAFDGIIAFGDHASAVAAGAVSEGYPRSQLVCTADLGIVELVLDCWMSRGDVVLVKGSRAMQMERVVHWLSADCSAERPQRASA